jgi:glutamate racemase
VLQRLLPPTVTRIDPAAHVVMSAAQELDLLGLRSQRPARPTRFCISGSPKPFIQVATPWLGCAPIVEQIRLPELHCLSNG